VVELLALILAVLAGVCFVAAAWSVSSRLNLVAAGLALLTSAWVAQVAIVGGYHWTVR
jgi:hypothetical protein